MGSLVRVEYYHDSQPDRPDAFERYMYRMGTFQKEYEIWQTVVLDSITFMELAARNREMYVLNPYPGQGSPYAKGSSFDTRQWHGGSTTAIEGVVITRYSGLPMNVVVTAHVHERQNELDGQILRGPWAPGRLSNRGLLQAAFQEQYHAYTYLDDKGKRAYALATENDGQWSATTQLGAPHPVYPDYNSLWVNWKGVKKPPIHVLIYSDTGTGKSTFASTFRQAGNVLVWCFDPKGKELPYMKGASKVTEPQFLQIPGPMGTVPVEYRDIIYE
jgi:hypothetical protein